MMTTSKPPLGLIPSSTTSLLPAFKRKRIEQWCDDVGHYLRAGSLCRSVLGHVLDDNRLAAPVVTVKSAPAASGQRTPHGNINSSVGTVTDMLALANKKDSAAGGGGGVRVTAAAGGKADVSSAVAAPAPSPGRGTPLPDTSGALPVVKFSYSHYNEQRRRTDRLVQGLPVLSAVGAAAGMERLSGTGTVIHVNGEEPGRVSGGFGATATAAGGVTSSRETQARTPVPGGRAASPSTGAAAAAAAGPHSNSSGEPRQRSSLPSHLHPASSRLGAVSPSTRSRPHPHPHPHSTSSSNVHGLQSPGLAGKTVPSSEIVVIEDEAHARREHLQHGGGGYTATGFRSMALNGLRRSQSQKVHKARQRVLAGSRRGPGDRNNTHTQVPVHSCWALAELTW